MPRWTTPLAPVWGWSVTKFTVQKYRHEPYHARKAWPGTLIDPCLLSGQSHDPNHGEGKDREDKKDTQPRFYIGRESTSSAVGPVHANSREGRGRGRAVRVYGRRQVNKIFTFHHISIINLYVRPTEYTQSGNGHFLAYISIMMENSAQPGVGGGCTPTSFHYIYHHEQSCGVRSSWEGRYTPPISSSPMSTLWSAPLRWFQLTLSPSVSLVGIEHNGHIQSRKRKSRYIGRGIDSRNRVWNWIAKLHRLAGRYDNPVPMRDLSYRLSLSSILPTLLVFC